MVKICKCVLYVILQWCLLFQKNIKKYDVSYFQCQQCWLLQTEEPYWLDEAYTSAIIIVDTGLTQRNISIASKLAVLIYFKFESTSTYLDIAGGYGMLWRLMRDYGFDFFWTINIATIY